MSVLFAPSRRNLKLTITEEQEVQARNDTDGPVQGLARHAQIGLDGHDERKGSVSLDTTTKTSKGTPPGLDEEDLLAKGRPLCAK